MSRVQGTFSDVSGQVVTSADLPGSTAAAVIAVSSVRTGNQMRDNHLRSADFFDAGRYPEMSFASTGVRPGRLVDAVGGADDPGRYPAGGLAVEFLGITFGLAADGTKIVIADKIDSILDVEAFLDHQM